MSDIVEQMGGPLIEEPSPANHSQSRDMRWVFLGPQGLRPGWGVALFVSIFAATYFLLAWLLQPVFISMTHGERHLQSMPLGLGFLAEGFQFTCMLVPTIALALLERKPILSYGYQGGARTLRLVSGFAWGFFAISTFVLVLWKAHLLSFDGQVLHGASIWKYAGGWGVMFLLVAFFEESALRGYLQFTLTRGIGFWWSALLLSFLFGFSHGTNPGESHVGLFSAGAVGLVFCLSLWYTGSLWFAVGLHAGWDWGQSFFYGTSDSGLVAQGHLYAERPIGKLLWSGGATGPEGSLLVIPLLALMALFMWLWWGRRGQSPFAGSGWRPAPIPEQR